MKSLREEFRDLDVSALDPYSRDLKVRADSFETIWALREKYSPSAYTRLFDEGDYWDPLLHGEFMSQHGWHRLGTA